MATGRLLDAAYARGLMERLSRERTPTSGTLELTPRCNLDCVHCYLGDKSRYRDEGLIPTPRLLEVIGEIAEAGCLYLLITGGEPLLHPDFWAVYERAKLSGMIVTLFTNGTTVTPGVAARLRELPPTSVEVSLYGMSEETTRRVTRVPGAYEACLRGMENLHRHGLHFSLKTILMTHNQGEIGAMRGLAESYGVDFRLDAAITPCHNGDMTPVALRVPAEDAVREEFRSRVRTDKWLDFQKRFPPPPPSDRVYQCGAGVNSFDIDFTGRLKACMMDGRFSHDLKTGDFMTGWREVIPGVRELRMRPGTPCAECGLKVYCGYCPALFDLEQGASEGPCSDYACSIGRLRYEIINNEKAPACVAGSATGPESEDMR